MSQEFYCQSSNRRSSRDAEQLAARSRFAGAFNAAVRRTIDLVDIRAGMRDDS